MIFLLFLGLLAQATAGPTAAAAAEAAPAEPGLLAIGSSSKTVHPLTTLGQ